MNFSQLIALFFGGIAVLPQNMYVKRPSTKTEIEKSGQEEEEEEFKWYENIKSEEEVIRVEDERRMKTDRTNTKSGEIGNSAVLEMETHLQKSSRFQRSLQHFNSENSEKFQSAIMKICKRT